MSTATRTAPSARVRQAQGMVSVQADCTVDCALVRLTNRAVRDRSDVEAVARAVVERRIRFSSTVG
jgi:hypothetical protein